VPKSPSNIVAGGSHFRVRKYNKGGEAHHMPGFAGIQRSGIALTYGKAPAICMIIKEHENTLSYKNKSYPEDQAFLIRTFGTNGFDVAQQIDIVDVRGKFGNKYDFGIIQMFNYTEQLQSKSPKLFR
jgi:hypothetical protein